MPGSSSRLPAGTTTSWLRPVSGTSLPQRRQKRCRNSWASGTKKNGDLRFAVHPAERVERIRRDCAVRRTAVPRRQREQWQWTCAKRLAGVRMHVATETAATHDSRVSAIQSPGVPRTAPAESRRVLSNCGTESVIDVHGALDRRRCGLGSIRAAVEIAGRQRHDAVSGEATGATEPQTLQTRVRLRRGLIGATFASPDTHWNWSAARSRTSQTRAVVLAAHRAMTVEHADVRALDRVANGPT